MRIGICDDREEMRKLIADKISQYDQDTEIAEYASAEELLAECRYPDILFLDIRMPGMSGLEAAKKIRRAGSDVIIIFITALEEYVFEAFDVRAFHYLVKPFSDEKFREVLAGAAEESERAKRKKEHPSDGDYIMVHVKGSHRKILVKNIIYAEVFNRKVVIHEQDGEVEFYGKLSVLEKALGEDFYRPHRAYLIHLKYVVRYDAASITMERGAVPLAKAKYPEFVKAYLKYNRRMGQENVIR